MKTIKINYLCTDYFYKIIINQNKNIIEKNHVLIDEF